MQYEPDITSDDPTKWYDAESGPEVPESPPKRSRIPCPKRPGIPKLSSCRRRPSSPRGSRERSSSTPRGTQTDPPPKKRGRSVQASSKHRTTPSQTHKGTGRSVQSQAVTTQERGTSGKRDLRNSSTQDSFDPILSPEDYPQGRRMAISQRQQALTPYPHIGPFPPAGGILSEPLRSGSVPGRGPGVEDIGEQYQDATSECTRPP